MLELHARILVRDYVPYRGIMKLYELKAIAKRLNQFTFISRARRIEDNTLEIMFDKAESYFFNMTRGHSFIYKAPSQRPLQGYNAPFDTLLHLHRESQSKREPKERGRSVFS